MPELYRFHVGDEAIRCASCQPGGEAPEGGPSMGRLLFPGTISPLLANMGMLESRNLAAGGDRAFFETAEALSLQDTNGQAKCPPAGTASQEFPACMDVYEWEAPGEGSCEEGTPPSAR